MLSTPLRFQLGKPIQSSSGIQRPEFELNRYAPPISVRAYTKPGSFVLKTIPGMKPPPPPITTLWKLYGPESKGNSWADVRDGLNGPVQMHPSKG